jgi:hypothetical protein
MTGGASSGGWKNHDVESGMYLHITNLSFL